jgi:hypothetical protein
MNGSALVKMGAKLARIAASGWTERTVHRWLALVVGASHCRHGRGIAGAGNGRR